MYTVQSRLYKQYDVVFIIGSHKIAIFFNLNFKVLSLCV